MTENSGVLDRRSSKSQGGKEGRLYSLVEVAQETGIPMPILLRYKREQPDRVPSEGSGSQQRFPVEAFDVLRQIQKEESEGRDLPRRGGFGLLSLPRLRRHPRPADDEVATAEAAATEAAGPAPATEPPTTGTLSSDPSSTSTHSSELLSLVDISRQVDIPYPTLARYATQYGDRIPHRGEGRNRRFPPAAVAIFEQIRKESKPGRPPKAKRQQAAAAATPGPPRASVARPAPEPAAPAAPRPGAADEAQLARRIATLEESQRRLEEQIRELLATLSKPASVTVHSS